VEDHNKVYGIAAVLVVLSALSIPDFRFDKIVSTTHAANLFVGLALISIYPFISYSLNWSESWTGLKLTEEEEAVILGPPGHVYGMFLWFALSLFQAVTFKRAQWIHNYVGYVGFFVLFLCLVEVTTNAIFVFLPFKPALLAKSTLGRDTVTVWETFLFSNCFAVPLLLPLAVLGHAYYAFEAVVFRKMRSGRLHAHHILSTMVWMLGPGILRLAMKPIWKASGSVPFDRKEDAIQVQMLGFHISGVALVTILSLIHSTLPIRLREDASVKNMRWMMIIPVVHGGFACWLLGVKPWPQPTYFESM